MLLLAVSLPAMGPAAWAAPVAVQDATVIEVTLRGGEVWGLVVEFARSIPGRRPDYTWSGVTDASGRLVLTIPATDQSLVSGDYQARALNLYGEVVGEWRSIPIDRNRRQTMELILDPSQGRRPPAGPEGGLVAHYPLDGDARDASVNAYHGTLSGPDAGEDRFGNEAGALVFHGTEDRIDLPHEVLDGLRDVSISFWLKTTKSGSQAIVSAANRSKDNEHIVYLWDQRNIHFFSHGTHGQHARFCWVDIPPIADGQWHHIVVIRNAVEGNAAFYVDGVGYTDLCGDLEYRALTVEEGGLILGQEQDRLGGDFDPNQVLDGSLDDLRIYDKVLSAAEVQTLLGQDDPGESPLEPEEPPVERPSPLVAYYPFNGDASDASGNEYHGALSGPEPGEDRFGNEAGALVFQGTEDRIDLPHEALDGLRDVSVSLWLKTTNSGQQAVVSGANRSNDNEYLIYLPREEQFILFSHGRAGRLQHECAVDVEPMADGRWHHIVWIRNASEGYSDFYVDWRRPDGRLRASGVQGPVDRGRGPGPRPGPGPAGRGICSGPGFPGIAGRSLDIRPGADGRRGAGPAGQGRARCGQVGGSAGDGCQRRPGAQRPQPLQQLHLDSLPAGRPRTRAPGDLQHARPAGAGPGG